MQAAGLFILFALGYSISAVLCRNLSGTWKYALAFPVGIGALSVLMFVSSLFHVPVNNIAFLLPLMGVISAAFFIYLFTTDKTFFISDLKNIKEIVIPENFAVIFFNLITFSLVVFSAWKSFYWPVFTNDSIDGYDYLAKVIAAEGAINNSVFDTMNPSYSIRTFYPPLVPFIFSFAHTTGFDHSQVILPLFFAPLIILFYLFLKKHFSILIASVFAFLLVTIPEFFAFSSLSSNNIAFALYSSAGVLCLYTWMKEKEKDYFRMGCLLLFFAAWTRSEALIFFLGALPFIVQQERPQFFKRILFLAFIILLPLLMWQFELNYILGVHPPVSFGGDSLFDGGRLKRMGEQIAWVTFNTMDFGIVPHLFFLAAILSIFSFFRNRNSLKLLASIFSSLLFYLFIFFMVDTDFIDHTGGGWIGSGYKRGLFCFLPLMVFFLASVISSMLLSRQNESV